MKKSKDQLKRVNKSSMRSKKSNDKTSKHLQKYKDSPEDIQINKLTKAITEEVAGRIK